MEIQSATLVTGTETPAGDGITGASRCVVRNESGVLESAILKRGSIGEICSEAFCSLLLDAWGLPTPNFYIIHESDKISFASVDTKYPNFKQRLNIKAFKSGPAQDALIAKAIDQVLSLPSARLAAACDEAIDNRDRNIGNVLWDGTEESWIDHAFCLDQGTHLPDRNLLCTMALGTVHEDIIKNGALAQAVVIDQRLPQDVNTVLLSSIADECEFGNFVAKRMSDLRLRLLTRFPSPVDLLSEV